MTIGTGRGLGCITYTSVVAMSGTREMTPRTKASRKTKQVTDEPKPTP